MNERLTINAGASDVATNTNLDADFEHRLQVLHASVGQSLLRIRLACGLPRLELSDATSLVRKTIRRLESQCDGTIDSLLRVTVKLGLAEKVRAFFAERSGPAGADLPELEHQEHESVTSSN